MSDTTKVTYLPRLKVVFISGPYSGESAWEIEQNVRRCEELQLEVMKLRLVPLCLNVMGRFFAGTSPHTGAGYDWWLDAACELLARSDAMLQTADWKRSGGCRKESQAAEDLGIPTFETITDLHEWAYPGTTRVIPGTESHT